MANEGNDLRVQAFIRRRRVYGGRWNQMLCGHKAESGWVNEGREGEGGEVPPPVEGGAAVGDHLVEVLKVMIICL